MYTGAPTVVLPTVRKSVSFSIRDVSSVYTGTPTLDDGVHDCVGGSEEKKKIETANVHHGVPLEVKMGGNVLENKGRISSSRMAGENSNSSRMEDSSERAYAANEARERACFREIMAREAAMMSENETEVRMGGKSKA